jgi:hypothetical protein
MDSNQTPKNSKSQRPRRLPEAAQGIALALEERVVWPVSEGAKSVFEVVRWPFEQAGWALRRALVWPARDRIEELDGRGRAFAAGGGLAVIAVGVTGLALAASGGSGTTPAPQVAAAPAPIVKVTPAPTPKPAPPTLHGAAPVFKPVDPKHASAKVDAAKQVETSPGQAAAPPSSSSSAATEKISSDPSSSSAGSGSAGISTVDGPAAGKEAIAVAREFSKAFVVFETGGDESTVRKAFAVTTTPALAKSLLKRPPRLPANVKVPKAKVLNVVAGPSHGGVYSLSVSLLRVGVTSELRLEMEKLKGEGWRVTNVLG